MSRAPYSTKRYRPVERVWMFLNDVALLLGWQRIATFCQVRAMRRIFQMVWARAEALQMNEPLWDKFGTPRFSHAACPVCNDSDEVGSHFDHAWCSRCGWHGSLTDMQRAQHEKDGKLS